MRVLLLGYPRHFAAASLKRHDDVQSKRGRTKLSAALCRGLIEAIRARGWSMSGATLSAALCRGLIEAQIRHRCSCACDRYPRHFAAASLKPGVIAVPSLQAPGYPRHFAAASLKLKWMHGEILARHRYPRHFAAASLKRWSGEFDVPVILLSAALCRGLIEAHNLQCWNRHRSASYPRHFAAASLKPFTAFR